MKIKEMCEVRPLSIILETPKEIDLFYHIVNFIPIKQQHYGFEGYEATFEEVEDMRKKLWDALEELGINLRGQKEDC